MLDINKYYNVDCLEGLKELDDNTIDLICIDPPYEINYQNEDWDKHNSLDWNFLFSEFNRLLKPTGNLIIFQGWSSVCNTMKCNNMFILKNWIIWDRIKGRGALTNFTSTREDILWFIKQNKDYTFNKIYSNIKKKTGGMGNKNGQENRSLSNVWYDISPIVPWSKERVDHSTQKPLQLMERLITIFSNEDDLVLDCFAGSGSTLVAAKNLKRNYIGIEINKNYCNIIKERLK